MDNADDLPASSILTRGSSHALTVVLEGVFPDRLVLIPCSAEFAIPTAVAGAWSPAVRPPAQPYTADRPTPQRRLINTFVRPVSWTSNPVPATLAAAIAPHRRQKPVRHQFSPLGRNGFSANIRLQFTFSCNGRLKAMDGRLPPSWDATLGRR